MFSGAYRWGFAAVVCLAGAASGWSLERESALKFAPRAEDYTLLWWADGPPSYLGHKAPPKSALLCLQSGTWGLAFDTQKIAAVRAGKFRQALSVAEATRPGRAELSDLPAVEWNCSLRVGDRRFQCLGHKEQKDEFHQPVRFVESGRWFQRVVIDGLIFADAKGEKFDCEARLEISAWPDRLAFQVVVTGTPPGTIGKIELQVGETIVSESLDERDSATLKMFEQSDAPRPTLTVDPALQAAFDKDLGCYLVKLPEKPWTNAKGTYYPEEHLDRLDRWRIKLENKTGQPTLARLMFVQQRHLPITGFTPMLCDEDGTPTGLPVQISKNWHRRPEKGTLLYEGPWFHGCAGVRLEPRSERELVFQLAYAKYGGVFAVSHAQLSLVGWGHNQFWDQVAIGSFGESICFEPGRVQRRCLITDVRPLLTLPQKTPAKPWGWAENCGGGDLLVWQNAQGLYQMPRGTRTNYRAVGPCLTDVEYTEETPGGEIAARVTVSVPRSDDHLRTFFRVRYDVQQPIRWQRLAFFQLGADFYNDTPARKVAYGDASGVRDEWEPPRAKDVYDRPAIVLTGQQPWVSIQGVEQTALRTGSAAASRGLIVRAWQAKLGGQTAAAPHAATFCTEWGKGNHRTVVELVPPPDVRELKPGDFVEAELELVVYPANTAAYYGPDKEFSAALAKDADTWRLVQREAAGNHLSLQTVHGTVRRNYPLEIAVDAHDQAEVLVVGGLGYVPLTFTGLANYRNYRVFVNNQPLDQHIHGHDFWQTDFDPVARRWQQTYNFRLSLGPLAKIRFEPEP